MVKMLDFRESPIGLPRDVDAELAFPVDTLRDYQIPAHQVVLQHVVQLLPVFHGLGKMNGHRFSVRNVPCGGFGTMEALTGAGKHGIDDDRDVVGDVLAVLVTISDWVSSFQSASQST